MPKAKPSVDLPEPKAPASELAPEADPAPEITGDEVRQITDLIEVPETPAPPVSVPAATVLRRESPYIPEHETLKPHHCPTCRVPMSLYGNVGLCGLCGVKRKLA